MFSAEELETNWAVNRDLTPEETNGLYILCEAANMPIYRGLRYSGEAGTYFDPEHPRLCFSSRFDVVVACTWAYHASKYISYRELIEALKERIAKQSENGPI